MGNVGEAYALWLKGRRRTERDGRRDDRIRRLKGEDTRSHREVEVVTIVRWAVVGKAILLLACVLMVSVSLILNQKSE